MDFLSFDTAGEAIARHNEIDTILGYPIPGGTTLTFGQIIEHPEQPGIYGFYIQEVAGTQWAQEGFTCRTIDMKNEILTQIERDRIENIIPPPPPER